MKTFDYYVGVLPEDKEAFLAIVKNLNESEDIRQHVEVKGEFDDPNGYYSYTVHGTWVSYDVFLQLAGNPIKSIEHFEE